MYFLGKSLYYINNNYCYDNLNGLDVDIFIQTSFTRLTNGRLIRKYYRTKVNRTKTKKFVGYLLHILYTSLISMYISTITMYISAIKIA